VIAGAIIALAAGVAIFVLAPLRRPAALIREDGQELGGRDEDAVLEALRDIELDRATGKLNDEDYADLRARYEARAADEAFRRQGGRSEEAVRPSTFPLSAKPPRSEAPTEGGGSA
jgi:hypothetical protein